ncbi:Fic family protein [Patescibacteria group bacterium]|nr:Fic family protein [Patescibacteria group bacterium]
MEKENKKQKILNKTERDEILSLLSQYSKTLSLLEQYDSDKLKEPKNKKGKFILEYENVLTVISEVKKNLISKKEASELFGNERDGSFGGIINGIYQTFDKKELYKSLDDKAVHLLYLIIKDHPFTDGNKRIASFLFVYFLDKNNYLYRKNGERKINDNALTALALLVAESNPKEKDTIISLIKNLISDFVV